MAETYWYPRKQGSLMAVPFAADGVTPSGIAVLHHEKKFKSLAIVIETNNTSTTQPGDVVLFKEGAADEFVDSQGETFFVFDEGAIVTTLQNIMLKEDKLVTDATANPIYQLP